MLGERKPTTDREAYDAGYDRGQLDGMKAYRTPKVLRPNEIPPIFDTHQRREHYVAGWKDGMLFSMRARGMAKTM